MNTPFTEDVLFEHYPMLAEMPPTLKQALLEEGQRIVAPAGTMLFNVGSPTTALPLLTSGLIRVERLARTGRKIMLYTVEPGDSCILTVSCLLGGSDYPAMGTVGSDITGLAVPRSLFMRLIEQSEVFRTFVFRYFSLRIVHLMELIEDLAWEKIRPRLAALLAQRPSVVEATHQAIADELGSVREVVSRSLKELETKGLVKLGRGQVRIVDREGLKKMAGL